MELNVKLTAFSLSELKENLDSLKKMADRLSEDLLLIRADLKVKLIFSELED